MSSPDITTDDDNKLPEDIKIEATENGEDALFTVTRDYTGPQPHWNEYAGPSIKWI